MPPRQGSQGEAPHSAECPWHQDWHACNCGAFDGRPTQEREGGASKCHRCGACPSCGRSEAEGCKCLWLRAERPEPSERQRDLLALASAEREAMEQQIKTAQTFLEAETLLRQASKAREKALEAALREYGQRKVMCASNHGVRPMDCDCGLRRALGEPETGDVST